MKARILLGGILMAVAAGASISIRLNHPPMTESEFLLAYWQESVIIAVMLGVGFWLISVAWRNR